MSRLNFLIRTKMLLTWRMYTRHSIASIESILFMMFYAGWLLVTVLGLRLIAERGFGFIVPQLFFADIFTFGLFLYLAVSLIGYRLNEGYDLNRFRTFPLPASTLFLANLIGSLLEIGTLLPIVAFASAFLVAGPNIVQFLAGLAVIIAYVIFMIIASQTVGILLYVLLPRVSTIKIMVIGLFGVLFWSLLLGLGGFRHPESWFNFHVLFVPVGIESFRHYPGGEVGLMLASILENDWDGIWHNTLEYTIRKQYFVYSSYPLLEFTGWTGGLLGLNYLLHALWMQNDIKKRTASTEITKNDPAAMVLNVLRKVLVGIAGPTAFELYRKDMLEYAFRSPFFLIYKIFPGSIAPIIIVFAMRWNLDPASGLIPEEFRPSILAVTIMLVLFIVIGQGILFASNQFGFEDANIKRLMAFPTPRREFLLGKNLFFAGLFLLDALIVASLAMLFFAGLYTFIVIFSVLVVLFTLVLTIGNFTSSIWPYWMPLDKPSFTLRSTVILSFVNMGSTIVLVIVFMPAAIMVLLPYLLNIRWLTLLMIPLALLYGFLMHRITLPHAVNLFKANEFLVLRRVADREQL